MYGKLVIILSPPLNVLGTLITNPTNDYDRDKQTYIILWEMIRCCCRMPMLFSNYFLQMQRNIYYITFCSVVPCSGDISPFLTHVGNLSFTFSNNGLHVFCPSFFM
uniref:Uncharacterized protein n=1 Tax=Cacopsylla melanoneura TaxID=428564 RepID=A0A8D8T250_9HEMI